MMRPECVQLFTTNWVNAVPPVPFLAENDPLIDGCRYMDFWRFALMGRQDREIRHLRLRLKRTQLRAKRRQVEVAEQNLRLDMQLRESLSEQW